MKMYIIFCVPAQILYGKSLALERFVKMLSTNEIADLLNQLFI